MKRLVLICALALLPACGGGWDYEARPIDGDGTKDETPKCFLIERVEHGWVHNSYFQQGRFCREGE